MSPSDVPPDHLPPDHLPPDHLPPDPAPPEDLDAVSAGLVTALLELERHAAGTGPDQPARLYALVGTDDLIAAEPALADHLGLRPTDGTDGTGLTGALTAVEQETFDPGADLVQALAGIEWPTAVAGCAVVCERSFLPAGAELVLPEDPVRAAAAVAEHPRRQDVLVVVGVLRTGQRHGVARLRSHPEELLGGSDLVPGLAEVLAYTLLPDAPRP